MKKDIHPNYRDVLFVDSSTGIQFVCGSSVKTEATGTYEGKEYPLCNLSTSSYSHPYFTGSNKMLDAEGRIGKFASRYANARQKREEQSAATKKVQPKKK